MSEDHDGLRTRSDGLTRLAFADATTEAICDSLDRDGYIIVESILPTAEVHAARDALRTILDPDPFQVTRFLGLQTKRLYSVPSRTRMCDSMLIHPLMSAVLENVLGHYLLSSTTLTDIYPGERAQTLHTDDSSWPVHLLAVDGEIELGVLWALDDFTVENGATLVVPGSHRWPAERRRAHGGEFAFPAVMTAGSALVYSGRVLHGGGANRSPGRRLGLVLTYVRSWLRQQEQFVITCPPQLARTFPPRLQEIVGYDVYPPLLGHVDARHPREHLGAGPIGLERPPDRPEQPRGQR